MVPIEVSPLKVGDVSYVTTRRCVVSNRNLACAPLIRRKMLSDGEIKVCLLSKQL